MAAFGDEKHQAESTDQKERCFCPYCGTKLDKGHAFVRIVVKLLSAMPKDLGKQDERNRLPETRQNARPSMRIYT